MPPNSTRILLDWGVGPLMGEKMAEPHGITFRQWQDGSAIAYTKLIPDFREKYNALYYVVRRAHFHDAMYQRALQLGVEVKVGHQVSSYEVATGSNSVKDGLVLSGDLIVAADGKAYSGGHSTWLTTNHRRQVLRTHMSARRRSLPATTYRVRRLQSRGGRRKDDSRSRHGMADQKVGSTFVVSRRGPAAEGLLILTFQGWSYSTCYDLYDCWGQVFQYGAVTRRCYRPQHVANRQRDLGHEEIL